MSSGTGALDRSSTIPLWSQLHDDLRRRIESGELVGTFPGELELGDEYGVSRNTVREALRELRAGGLVIAGRGRRSRVGRAVSIEQQFGARYSLFSSVEAAGMEHRSVVRALDIRRDEAAARALRRDPALPLLHLERLRLADGQPLALDRVWFPADLAAPLLDADFTRVGFYDELASRTQVRLTGGFERLRAVVPDRVERALLAVPAGVAAFRIERVGCAGDERVEWRTTLARGDRFDVVTRFSATDGYHLSSSGAPGSQR
ncbi:MAG TPA: GntR family transcriptional regulator [Acidimicrobiales bacterium]|nr:GntR family transcriptional regulator [Acidimicrobiales bacterium]